MRQRPVPLYLALVPGTANTQENEQRRLGTMEMNKQNKANEQRSLGAVVELVLATDDLAMPTTLYFRNVVPYS